MFQGTPNFKSYCYENLVRFRAEVLILYFIWELQLSLLRELELDWKFDHAGENNGPPRGVKLALNKCWEPKLLGKVVRRLYLRLILLPKLPEYLLDSGVRD